MSEIKRIGLTTLEPHKATAKAPKKYSRSLRIHVVLSESTEELCPVFHYKDELASAKKKLKQPSKENKDQNSLTDGLDPFGEENDEDVKRIALEMEAKYGTGITNGKKKHKGCKDDYADIGAGYDESDSFIDNTDGYDEIIPHNITTARGGFYINSGALEFKTDNDATSGDSSNSSESSEGSESESENEDKDSSKIKRKRVLDSTDEESNDASSKDEKKPKLDQPSKISMALAIKKKMFSPHKIQIKKSHPKKPDNGSKENRVADERRLSGEDRGKFDYEKETKKDKKPMRISSVNDAINSVIARVEKASFSEKTTEPQDIQNGIPSETRSSSNPGSPSPDPSSESSKTEIPELPENLPSDILESIESLKKQANEYKEGGKVKFFSRHVNILLLNLERKCKILGRSSQVKVYDHLAPFVKCKKETLMRRAKNLVLQDEQRKLDKTVVRLKSEIESRMPKLIAKHEAECQKMLQLKNELTSEEQAKHLKVPYRKFTFSEDSKRIIKDILFYKKRCFVLEGMPKTLLEENLLQYLKSDIFTLWPEGWMSMTILKKFCNMATLKTPNPKNANNNVKHSEKTANNIIPASSTSHQGNYLTITPINLCDKINEVKINSTSQKLPETIVKSHIKNQPSKEIKSNEAVFVTTKSSVDKTSSSQSTNSKSIFSSTAVGTANSAAQSTIKSSATIPAAHSNSQSTSKSSASIPATHSNSHSISKSSSSIPAAHSNSHSISKSSSSIPAAHSNSHSISKSSASITAAHSSSQSISKNRSTTTPMENTNQIASKIKSSSHAIAKPSDSLTSIKTNVSDSSSNSQGITAIPPSKMTTSGSQSISHCQVIDLTDQFSSPPPPATAKVGERRRSTLELERELGSPTQGDDLQKVMESLKALQKMSSPAKTDLAGGSAPVSVIAFNANHQATPASTLNSVGLQDEFQKQFMSGLKQSSNSSYNKCS